MPKGMQASVARAIRDAYAGKNAKIVKRRLLLLAKQLEDEHPSASRSLLEGLDETLTIMSLKLPEALTRALSSTNVIENLNSQVRRITRRVKRWRGGSMILRWVAGSYTEAERNFRRIRGYKGLSRLIAALHQRDAKFDQEVDALQQVA